MRPAFSSTFRCRVTAGPLDLERLGEFANGGFAEREAGQNRAPRRVGEGGKGRAQAVRHLYFANTLNNM